MSLLCRLVGCQGIHSLLICSQSERGGDVLHLKSIDLACASAFHSSRLPPNLGSMTALQYLDLAYNAFTGVCLGMHASRMSYVLFDQSSS